MNTHLSVYTGVLPHTNSCAQVYKKSHSGLKVCNFLLKTLWDVMGNDRPCSCHRFLES
jgi:hypothetical protein